MALNQNMKEKMYKCKYRHCLKPSEKVSESEAVMFGKRHYHKECAALHTQIERIKRIYFDFIDDKSDYVQVVGVINNLIFKKGYSPDYVEFMMKYSAVYCARNFKSPYLLHTIIENGIVEKMYKNDKQRRDVIERFDYRFRKG